MGHDFSALLFFCLFSTLVCSPIARDQNNTRAAAPLSTVAIEASSSLRWSSTPEVQHASSRGQGSATAVAYNANQTVENAYSATRTNVITKTISLSTSSTKTYPHSSDDVMGASASRATQSSYMSTSSPPPPSPLPSSTSPSSPSSPHSSPTLLLPTNSSPLPSASLSPPSELSPSSTVVSNSTWIQLGNVSHSMSVEPSGLQTSTTGNPSTVTGMGNSTTTKSPQRKREEMYWTLGLFSFCILGFTVVTLMYCRDNWAKCGLRMEYRQLKDEQEMKKAAERKRIVARENIPAIPQALFLKEYKAREGKGQLDIEYEIIQNRLRLTNGDISVDNISSTDTSSSFVNFSMISTVGVPRTIQEGTISGAFVDGFCQREKFLPITEFKAPSRGDFWKIVWNNNVQSIAMMKDYNVYGKYVTVSYWPDQLKEKRRYGNYDVTLLSKVVNADYQVSRLKITKVGGRECRFVAHCRLLDLIDRDSQNMCGLELLHFRRVMRKCSNDIKGPILVHGSPSLNAKYIACDITLKQIRAKKNISIFYNCMRMLSNVSSDILHLSSEDYCDVYRIIGINARCGKTVAKIDQIAGLCKHLSYKNSRSKVTGYHQEMKYIREFVTPLTSGQCAGGFRDENRSKNREATLLPPDAARPYLSTLDQEPATDYINAVYVQDFRDRKGFIVTEWPMKQTTNAFWRLLYDYDVTAVVILHKVTNLNSWGYPKFWPMDITNSVNYGPVDVQLTSCKRDLHLHTRTYAIQKKSYFPEGRWQSTAISKVFQLVERLRKVKHVTFYQFVGWRELSTNPKAKGTAISLARKICETRNKFKDRPVCIMSKDGCTDVGVFCTSVITYDQMTSDREVDVFNAVRSIKLNRPELVSTTREYTLCYTLALDMCLAHAEERERRLVDDVKRKRDKL